MANLALPVKCDVCYSDLMAETRVVNYETAVFVSPCPKCEDVATKAAYDAGETTGFDYGVKQGYEDCEEKYKDDIRAAVKLTQDVCAESKDGEIKPRASS